MIKELYKKASEKIAARRRDKENVERLVEAAATLVTLEKQFYLQLPKLLEQKPKNELEHYKQHPELLADKPDEPTYTYWSFSGVIDEKLYQKGWPLIPMDIVEFNKKALPTQDEINTNNELHGVVSTLFSQVESSKLSARMYLGDKDAAHAFIKQHVGDVEAVAAELQFFDPKKDLKPYHKWIAIGGPMPGC